MSDALSAKTESFLRAVQHADDPTRDDYDRVHAGVRARLAASVAAGVAALVTAKAAAASEVAAVTAVGATATTAVVTATTVTTATVGSTMVPASGAGAALATKLAVVLLVVGAAAGGTAAVVTHRQAVHDGAGSTPVQIARAVPVDRPAPQARPPTPVQAVATVPAAPIETAASPALAPAPTLALAPAPSLATAVAAESTPAPSSLDAEIALVREARAALQGGDAGRTLALLDEHARRFPRGALAEDCDAERIHALCALGRDAEARSLATRFLTGHPASPHAPSVRTSCGGGMN